MGTSPGSSPHDVALHRPSSYVFGRPGAPLSSLPRQISRGSTGSHGTRGYSVDVVSRDGGYSGSPASGRYHRSQPNSDHSSPQILRRASRQSSCDSPQGSYGSVGRGTFRPAEERFGSSPPIYGSLPRHAAKMVGVSSSPPRGPQDLAYPVRRSLIDTHGFGQWRSIEDDVGALSTGRSPDSYSPHLTKQYAAACVSGFF